MRNTGTSDLVKRYRIAALAFLTWVTSDQILSVILGTKRRFSILCPEEGDGSISLRTHIQPLLEFHVTIVSRPGIFPLLSLAERCLATALPAMSAAVPPMLPDMSLNTTLGASVVGVCVSAMCVLTLYSSLRQLTPSQSFWRDHPAGVHILPNVPAGLDCSQDFSELDPIISFVDALP